MYGLHNVIHRLSCALNQLKLENPWRRFPISTWSNQNRSRCGLSAHLLTSATIVDAREVFEIVIEIQLMVLYAIKIYCKHINERDMDIFCCQPPISASNRSSSIRRTRPCRQLDPVNVGPRRTRPRRTRPCHSVAGAWPPGAWHGIVKGDFLFLIHIDLSKHPHVPKK